MKESFVHVYTGNGKGKTTAAFGLALRAAGRGKCVKIVQFLKGRDTGEVIAVSGMSNIEAIRVSDCKKFFNMLTEKEKANMRDEVNKALPVIESWLGKADLLILDEALGAVVCGILTTDEMLSIINAKGKTEIVLTGRDAPEEILKNADLITEMKDIKHYYNEGVPAREGIEY
jgi:cob(I)alamin adenosyltransferase